MRAQATGAGKSRGLFSKRRTWVGIGGAVLLTAFALGGRGIDVAAFHAWVKTLSGPGVAGLVGVLPMLGFPVSAVHLAAGLRFSFGTALLIVGAATLCHHVLAWSLARALPRRLLARLEPWREKLAGAGHREAAVLCCILPGMPYSVQLYLLPVMGVPLRVLCFVSVPLHTLRATVTILIGNVSDALSPARLAWLAAYYALVVVACAFTVRRMRRSLAQKREAAAGEAPRRDERGFSEAEEGGAPMDATDVSALESPDIRP